MSSGICIISHKSGLHGSFCLQIAIRVTYSVSIKVRAYIGPLLSRAYSCNLRLYKAAHWLQEAHNARNITMHIGSRSACSARVRVPALATVTVTQSMLIVDDIHTSFTYGNYCE